MRRNFTWVRISDGYFCLACGGWGWGGHSAWAGGGGVSARAIFGNFTTFDLISLNITRGNTLLLILA